MNNSEEMQQRIEAHIRHVEAYKWAIHPWIQAKVRVLERSAPSIMVLTETWEIRFDYPEATKTALSRIDQEIQKVYQYYFPEPQPETETEEERRNREYYAELRGYWEQLQEE